MFDVVALGELLIDFTQDEKSRNGNLTFERNPGGAPANLISALSKFGKKTAFIGKVGNDQFGNYLRSVINDSGIDTTGLVFSDEFNTTLAFVHLTEDGDRDFSFYRSPGADMMLSEDEINYEIIKKSRIFHFGSVSMTDEPSRTATLKAAKYAKNNGCIVSFDPNLRINLWKNESLIKDIIEKGLYIADILKLSEEELIFLTGIEDLNKGSAYLFDKFEIPYVFVTLGSKGCYYRANGAVGCLPGYSVNVIDTTGAGDSFLSGILYKFIETGKNLGEITSNEIKIMVDFANAVGALTTTKRGAIPSMPFLEEAYDLIESTKRKYM